MFQEKKTYVDKAAELKAEYDKAMETYRAENGEVLLNSQIPVHHCCLNSSFLC